MPYSAHFSEYRLTWPPTGTSAQQVWNSYPAGSLMTPITKGVKPRARIKVFVSTPGWSWYASCRIGVLEIPA